MVAPAAKSKPRIFLREWRESRGLSLADMVRRTSFHKSTLSRIETGKTPYYPQVLEAYAAVLGIPVYTLIHRPPGGADELFTIIDQLLDTEGNGEKLRKIAQLTSITKTLLQ